MRSSSSRVASLGWISRAFGRANAPRRPCGEDPLSVECRIAGEHDAGASFQRPADRGVGTSAHNERFSVRDLADMLHIVGQPPRETAVLADHFLAVERNDERDAPGQTAIFALIDGWCW